MPGYREQKNVVTNLVVVESNPVVTLVAPTGTNDKSMPIIGRLYEL